MGKCSSFLAKKRLVLRNTSSGIPGLFSLLKLIVKKVVLKIKFTLYSNNIINQWYNEYGGLYESDTYNYRK